VSRLALTRAFWNEAPCDGQISYAARSRFRYRKDPWIVPLLERVAATHHNILEVGCGQGTDGVTLCRLLTSGGSYTGIDLSENSLKSAATAATEVWPQLQVKPVFTPGNAEELSFPDNRFDCVLSIGALHHTDDISRAIGEIRRVLTPSGTALVCLYRTLSAKLLSAHALRGVQTGLDTLLRRERCLFQAARTMPMDQNLGTAVFECFGVPILNSYTRRQMSALFREFSSKRFTAHGAGIPLLGLNRFLESPGGTPLGYLWLAEVRK
jgi:SAM-dependent methyltransferase